MKLRLYQTQAVEGIQQKFKQGYDAVCLILMMGLGKTIISCRIMQLVNEKKNRTLFLAHRTFLVTQVRDKLLKFNLPCGIIKSGFKEDRTQRIQVASIQTLKNRPLPLADIVIVDECHRAISKEYLKVLEQYKKAGSRIVGLTATPFRTSSREGLNILFDTYVNTINVREAVDKGYIVESKVYLAKKFIDTTNVKKSKGDFDEQELMKLFDVSDAYCNFINAYHTHIGNKKTIIFCVNKEHCKKTHEALIKEGYRGNYIISDTNEEERSLYLDRLVKGQYDYVVNCDVYSEGFDEPSIEAICLCFATTSKNKYFQRAGRGNRPLPEDEGLPFEKRKKKFFTILDMANNTTRFMPIEFPFEINLAPQKTKDKSGIAPIKSCPSCGYMMAAQIRKCPECGLEMVVKKSKQEIEQEIFVELDKKRMEVQKYLGYGKDRWNEIPTELLEAYAKAKGFKSSKGWVNYQLLARKEGGSKKVVIRNYDEPDYFKHVGWLKKAYSNKIPIDAKVWQFIEETDREIVFEYKLKEKEVVL